MRVAAILVLLPLLGACQPALSIPGRAPDPRGPLTQPDPTPAESAQEATLFGWASDTEGWVLPNVSVRENDRHHGTRTNSAGYFELRLRRVPPGGIVRVIAQANGYQSVEVPVPIRGGSNRVDLVLQHVEPAQQKTVASGTSQR